MTDPGQDGWTFESFRTYVDSTMRHLETLIAASAALSDSRFNNADKAVLAALAAQEKAVQAALAAAERAVGKSEVAAEKRFDSTNEFRGQLNDVISTFIPRAEAEQRIGQNTEKIDVLAARVDKIEGRSSGMGTSWAILIAAIGAIGIIVGIYLALR